MATIQLYRAAKDDIVTDCASFAETLETARLYADNPGFGGHNLYRCTIETDGLRILDLTEEANPTGVAADAIGRDHPGSIGADAYVPSISYQLRDAGYHWVRVCESYPVDTITWIWVGGDDPEMNEVSSTEGLSEMATNEPVTCESGEMTGERCDGKPELTVEWMPLHLRSSHRECGNSGVWPHNGAVRRHVCQECAISLLKDDPEWTSEIR